MESNDFIQAHEDIDRGGDEFRLAFDSSQVAMSFVGGDLKFVRVNRALCQMLGYCADELVGRSIVEITHPEDRARSQDLKGMLLRREIAQYSNEKRYLSKSGASVWVSMNAQLIDNAKTRSAQIFAFFEDITKRKETDSVLSSNIQTLEESNRHLREFSRVASHDLKEPLNTISAFLSLMAEQTQSGSQAELANYFEVIERAAHRMRALIDNLLNYAQLDGAKPELVEVDLAVVVRETLHGIQNLTGSANAVILVDKLPMVKGDRHQLSRLFQNLVVNAIKYCVRDYPEVKIHSRRHEGHWIVSVADNGPGIPKEDLANIFLPLRRGHSKASIPGTGLGLAICKQIAEMHAGRIWVESTSDDGTIFSVAIPESIASVHATDIAPLPGWPV